VGNSVKRITGIDSRLRHRGKLGHGNGSSHFLIHRDLAPLLRGDEAIPIECGRTSENSIEVIWKLLGLLMTLATTGRTAIPIGKLRIHRVIDLRDLLGPNRLLVNAIEGKVPDKSEVKAAIRIQRPRAIANRPKWRGTAPGVSCIRI